MDNTELIRVAQLPIIEEQLLTLKEQIEKKVADALSLVCDEETVQDVKTVRAELRKDFEDLEERRKTVKKAIMGPYEQFEAIYRVCVSDSFRRADAALKTKIGSVENEIKLRCETGLRGYFVELCAAERIDFLRYEDCGVKVDMTTARQKTQRKLREQIASFVVGVSQDVNTISKMENVDEIMDEFKQSLSLSKAIATVQERHRRIAEEREARAARESITARESETVAKVEALAPPAAIEPPVEEEKVFLCTFTVTATKSKLKKLKEFLIKEEIQYG